MAKQTVNAPKAPRRPSAPKAPKANGAKALKPPSAPKAASAPKAPKMPRPRAAAAPAAAPTSKNEAELLKQIEGLKAQVATLTETVAKAKAKGSSKSRTREEILEGVDVPKNDWRHDYQGAEILTYRHRTGKDQQLYVEEGDTSTLPGFLALPRDNDVGGQGSHARNSGMIAVHWDQSEDGTRFIGAPLYVTMEELALIWAE